MLKNIFYVILGGVFGTLSRYSICVLINLSNSNSVFATLLVNLLGCLIAGCFFGASQTLQLSTNLKLFIFMGFLGAFTTFSTFALDNYTLLQANKMNQFLLNIFLNNFLGLGCLFLGIMLTKKLFTH